MPLKGPGRGELRFRKRRGIAPKDSTVKYAILKTPLTRTDIPDVIDIPEDNRSRRSQFEQLQEAVAVKKELIRRSARTSLLIFARDILGYTEIDEDVHGELCHRLEDAYWGRGHFLSDENMIRRYLFLLPRGTFKSTIATIAYPLWILTQNDPISIGDQVGGWQPPISFNKKRGHDQRILIGSEIDANATRFLQNIKDHTYGTERLLEFFGMLAPEKKRGEGLWTKGAINTSWRLDFRHKEANLSVTSMDATPNSGHFDIGIFDDMISEKQVANEEQILQTVEWYRRQLPILDKPSVMVFIGTRWHDKDLYGHFLDEERGKWEFYREAAERTEEEILAGKRKYFFPRILGEKELEDLRTSMRPYLFSCQYYNNPILSSDALFKKEYFEDRYYTLPPGEHLATWLANKTIFTTIDPAISSEKRACHAVVVTMAWDPAGNGYVLDLFREKNVHPAALLDAAFDHYQRWKPILMGIEQDGFQKMFKFEADQRSQNSGVWPPWIELKPNRRAKELRIGGLEPLWRAKRIWLRADTVQSHTVIEDEALRFPRGRSKDTLDAMAYQLDIAFPGSEGPKPAPQPESKAFYDAMFEEMHDQRARRLRIDEGVGVGVDDWYNM